MILSGDRLPSVACNGVLVIGDPHVGSRRPGRRKDAVWPQAVLGKLERCVAIANERQLAVVILGDLFDRPVETDVALKNQLIRVLKGFHHRPIVNVGNHDIQHTTLTDGDSLALLGLCDVVDVVAASAPVTEFQIGSKAHRRRHDALRPGHPDRCARLVLRCRSAGLVHPSRHRLRRRLSRCRAALRGRGLRCSRSTGTSTRRRSRFWPGARAGSIPAPSPASPSISWIMCRGPGSSTRAVRWKPQALPFESNVFDLTGTRGRCGRRAPSWRARSRAPSSRCSRRNPRPS